MEAPDPDPAAHALALVGSDPRAALAAADAIVARHPRPATPEAARSVSLAHRAAGLALRDLGDPSAGERRLRRAISVAERAHDDEGASEARMSLAYVLLERGQLRAALSSVDHASAVATGEAAARVRTTRALVLQRSGRTREAMDEYAEALPALQRGHDLVWEARLRNNRALLVAYEGDTESAVADLTRAHDLYLELERGLDATSTLLNLGWVLGMNGEIPAALALFDRADAELDEVGDIESPERWVDRAEVYLRAGLVADATASARTAVQVLDGRGWDALEAEARLLLALCLLASGSLDHSHAEAVRARAMFARQDRPTWTALGDYVVMRSRFLLGASAKDLDDAVQVAATLRDVGWDGPAADLRVCAGRAALLVGDLRHARTLLGPLASRGRVRRLDVRSRAWFARALLCEAAGDRRAADLALRRSWKVIEHQRMLVGATELRAGVATHAVDLVDTGARLAVEADSAVGAFDWGELGRAAALRYRPALPPADRDLARTLTRLRWAVRADEDARLQGERDSIASAARARLEGDVVRMTRQGSATARALTPVTARDVRARLRDEVFLQFLVVGSRLWVVVVGPRRTTLHEVGDASEVAAAVSTITFGLRRVLTGFGTRSGLAAATESRRRAAERLDALLLSPVRREIGDADVVVCPVGSLVHLPWPLLEALHGRTTHVAPSATIWCAARDRADSRPRRVVAVAGPGLEGAAAEVAAVGRVHPGALMLVGEQARVDDVLRGAETATVLHLAAHGRLRKDNPLFSSVALADGPLTAYDLESLEVAPSSVLLPACNSGAGHAQVAEETLGLAWTLLGMGTSCVVAPLLPVPDAATHPFMLAVHEGFAGRRSLAESVARAQADTDRDDPVAAAVASTFVAFGD